MVEPYEDASTLLRRARAMLNSIPINAMGEADCLIEIQLLEEELKETEAAERKKRPVATGVIDYFPDALMAVANLSWVGNEQHNPGTPLHWDRSKSTDEADALMRHFIERGKIDADGVRHSAKVAWRALALLQKEIESTRDAPPTAIGAGDKFYCHACNRGDRFVASEVKKAFGDREFVFDNEGRAHLLSDCTRAA